MAALADDDPRHGTTSGYGNHGCRCDRCRAAKAEAQAEYMARIKNEGRTLGQHGSRTCYDSGCRCDICREAHNTRSREYKRKRREEELQDRRDQIA